MAKEAVAPGFVLGVVSDVDPKQTTGAPPTIENDSVVERLVHRSHDQRVVLVRFLFPGRSPMKHESVETELPQARADVVSVIGADAPLFDANVDEIIVHGRIAVDAIVARALSRRLMRNLRQQLRLARVNRLGRERDQRVTQIRDRFFVLGRRGCRQGDGNQRGETDFQIHIPV